MTDSILRSYYNVSSSTFVPFAVAVPASGANLLLDSETQGFAFDATTSGGTVSVKDTGTPANNKSNVALSASNIANGGTSTKYVLWDDGTVHLIATGQAAQQYDAALAIFGILSEPSSINLALRSNDFTNASWTKSNMSTSLTATGPDGVASGATILTASAGNATALQAITSASSARITSCWIKRRTGSGNIDLTQDNGGTWTTQSVTGSWTRFNLSSVTSTDPTVGIRIVTSGDEVDVWGFQHETKAFVTTTIPTLGVTVTRAADSISVAKATVPTSVTEFGEWAYAKVAIVSGQSDILNYHGGGSLQMYVSGSNTNLFAFDGGVQASFVIGAVSNATAFKVAARYKANDFHGAQNGTLSSSPDTSGAMPTMTIGYYIGRSQSSAPASPVYIYKGVAVPRIYSNAELQSVTT